MRRQVDNRQAAAGAQAVIADRAIRNNQDVVARDAAGCDVVVARSSRQREAGVGLHCRQRQCAATGRCRDHSHAQLVTQSAQHRGPVGRHDNRIDRVADHCRVAYGVDRDGIGVSGKRHGSRERHGADLRPAAARRNRGRQAGTAQGPRHVLSAGVYHLRIGHGEADVLGGSRERQGTRRGVVRNRDFGSGEGQTGERRSALRIEQRSVFTGFNQ